MISYLKIKSNFKILRVALSDVYTNSHNGATLPDAGWCVAIAPL